MPVKSRTGTCIYKRINFEFACFAFKTSAKSYRESTVKPKPVKNAPLLSFPPGFVVDSRSSLFSLATECMFHTG